MGFLDRLLGREEPRPNGSQQQNAGYQPYGGPGAAAGAPAPTGAQPRSEDEIAVERYRYLLRTAPPETIEQVHEEAFAKLTPEQRRMVFEQLSQNAPAGEQPRADDPRSLAQAATRSELRQPGTLERSLGGYGGGGGRGGFGGPGLGSMFATSLLGSVAGYVIGSAIVSSFLPSPADNQADAGSGDQNADNANDQNNDGSGDGGSGDQGGDGGSTEAAGWDGGSGGDAGGGWDGGSGADAGGWGGGDWGGFGGGDFGGGDFGGGDFGGGDFI
ncbi:MAG: hypothetical protein AAGC66_13550 [Leifsonia sp.]